MLGTIFTIYILLGVCVSMWIIVQHLIDNTFNSLQKKLMLVFLPHTIVVVIVSVISYAAIIYFNRKRKDV